MLHMHLCTRETCLIQVGQVFARLALIACTLRHGAPFVYTLLISSFDHAMPQVARCETAQAWYRTSPTRTCVKVLLVPYERMMGTVWRQVNWEKIGT